MTLRSRMTAEGTGWYAHTLVVRQRPEVLVVAPLHLTGQEPFPTLEAANAAATALALAWIDREEREAR